MYGVVLNSTAGVSRDRSDQRVTIITPSVTSRGSTSPADCSLLLFSRTCRLVHAVVSSEPRC